jgi:hypothetical protein
MEVSHAPQLAASLLPRKQTPLLAEMKVWGCTISRREKCVTWSETELMTIRPTAWTLY